MANISIQDLQDIAVRCTSDFFNNNVPLNESLAKQASDLGLNSDQLQRAIEATNTLTYLKGVDAAKDRTAEFPVADYAEIVKLASIPESLQKEASAQEVVVKPSAAEKFNTLVKQAESGLTFTFPELSQAEQKMHLLKQASINKRALEDAEINLDIAGRRLVKLASELKKHPQGLEHLSATDISNSDFEKIASLVFGPGTKRKDYVAGMFKSAQLSTAQEFAGLYKEAQTLFSEVEYRRAKRDEIEKLEKVAFLSALTGLVKARGVSGAASYTAGKAVGKVINKTTVGTVKTVGKTVGGVAGTVGSIAKNKVQNAAAGTAWGKELKIPKAELPASTKKKIALTMTAGGAALDASFHVPKVDPAKDMSGDVWKALQG